MLIPDSLLSSSTWSPSWLDSALGQSKQGVFTADFEGENNTRLELEDGDNIMLDCKVFLRKDKTVSLNSRTIPQGIKFSPNRSPGYATLELHKVYQTC